MCKFCSDMLLCSGIKAERVGAFGQELRNLHKSSEMN